MTDDWWVAAFFAWLIGVLLFTIFAVAWMLAGGN